MAKTNDKIVHQLLDEVKKRRSEISTGERANYKTNMSFPLDRQGLVRKNLQVESDVDELIKVMGFLSHEFDFFQTGAKILELSDREFKWFGFTYQEWLVDIRTRVAKIQVSSKKRELEVLESRLNNLVSKELRDKKELEDIMQEIKK